jgi:hypothetical protein
MTLSVTEFAGRARDSRWERDLARELRRHPEPERFRFIEEFLDHNIVVALELARRCLTQRTHFELLLKRGVFQADARSIRYWLEAIVPHLGFRRVVAFLREQVSVDRGAVERAIYWLPTFEHEPGYSVEAIRELRALARSAALGSQPTSP